MPPTIGETVEELHDALRDYIEATYHIGHASLIEQRRELLQRAGVIRQKPYLESTPRYKAGQTLSKLGLPPAALAILTAVSTASGDKPLLIHDPPYQHQAMAIKTAIVDRRSMVVMTGTGSGKTECFLLPILGKLAVEAKKSSASFADTPAMRAIVLYPMNALVNDQLGRLRLLFGDDRIVERFIEWTGRPARFARYTSRTLYPGVRTEQRDQRRLKSIGDYYVRNLEKSTGPESAEQATALKLVNEFKRRGKWPAKPDLLAWYGTRGSRWKNQAGEYKRCITLPHDPELFTRHEVQEAPPDVLVTNYSMLEYMLMRPLERPIFDCTKEWLKDNPDERLLLVIDEAHLYRGAAGAEVALLIRRLRARVGITADRLQVICTSASFRDATYAPQFGAQLTGKSPSDFDTISGELNLRELAATGSSADATALSAIDLDKFYAAESEEQRIQQIQSFLKYRSTKLASSLGESLYDALNRFPVMERLINQTMTTAQPVDTLGSDLFPETDADLAARGVTALIALGSVAKKDPTAPGLLPCRIHSFHRGLAGLWACMDPHCSAIPSDKRGGPCGQLFSQPRDACDCGARVLELYTCRNCGTAYGRAYTDNTAAPDFLWAEPGGAFRTVAGLFAELEPIDLLLEAPLTEEVEPADYDLVTGRINPQALGDRVRQVFLRRDRTQAAADQDEDEPLRDVKLGEFVPCGVCRESPRYGRSTVQDHQTKGDQPFQALIARQIKVQPPNATMATKLAPLRGRKVLIFSDSRQTAARLAPNLQTYSTQDAIRPLLVAGFSTLQQSPGLAQQLSLRDLYLAVLVAAINLGVRLRPEVGTGETFNAAEITDRYIRSGALANEQQLNELFMSVRDEAPPQSLLRAMMLPLTDRYYGLESLALASLIEKPRHQHVIISLPDIPNVAATNDQKLAFARLWIRAWRRPGIWLSHMPQNWLSTEIKPHKGSFEEIDRRLGTAAAKRVFKREWLPKLLMALAEPLPANKFRLKGSELTLRIGGEWAYCQSCRTTQRPFPGSEICINCGRPTAVQIDPDTDNVFKTRKWYYRASTVEALRVPPVSPLALIAAEHTAQLNAAVSDEVFSKAEEHELLFQDVDLGHDERGQDRPAVDVLSCTTTMEVGIDIGTLSGVSLRNMPPARANYQQRAGRAGRRGNAVATVTAFGSADSHDEHYFTHPDEMIRGPVNDPTLTLNNLEIVKRHVTAFLLQAYHQDRLPDIAPEQQPHLFAVLGYVSEFKRRNSTLNRDDFAAWAETSVARLRNELSDWLPSELDAIDREELLANFVPSTLAAIDAAIEYVADEADDVPSADEAPSGEASDPAGANEIRDEEGEEQPLRDPASENLLDRLLYKGVLPRYAFPTDVATFHVFDAFASTRFRPVFRFAPSQGLPVALSEYAPGKEVWIGNNLWSSGAIYSPMRKDRSQAWHDRRLYYECSYCRYACTVTFANGTRGEKKDCPACGNEATFGPARNWLRPPGFAHPVDREQGTSPDDQPARSYATRAKLEAPTPAEPEKWTVVNDRIRAHHLRKHLLVTNRGPRQEGYSYCTLCGRIEPTALPVGTVSAAHRKPYPDEQEPNCPGGRSTIGLVLGTDFITDVLLVSVRVSAPLTLSAGLLATDVALRTVSEALTKAASKLLGLEPQELQAEYRPALTEAGRAGSEAEIYMYDTLPGGAGFARRVGELGMDLFREALRVLEDCPEGCDRSCYRCLRSYKNKFEHDLLDRQVGASLLRFLIDGVYPALDPARLSQSTDVLYEDIVRQNLPAVAFERNRLVTIAGYGNVTAPIYARRADGTEVIIGVHGPLTPDDPPDEQLRDLKEHCPSMPVLLFDEIVIRRNLPSATTALILQLG